MDRPDVIPAEVLQPKEEAIGEAANWLHHPNELGAYPESLEISDHREMHWPPTSDKITAPLLKWKLGDDEGIVMIGSITWCFFSEESEDPLEVYGRHCTWEFEHKDDFELDDNVDKITYGANLLKNSNPDMDWTPQN